MAAGMLGITWKTAIREKRAKHQPRVAKEELHALTAASFFSISLHRHRRTPLSFTSRTVRQVFRLDGVSDEETEDPESDSPSTNHQPSQPPTPSQGQQQQPPLPAEAAQTE